MQKHTRGSLEKNIWISAGERRRCSIASQIMANPKIIFLDESNKGFDSHRAETLKNRIDICLTDDGVDLSQFLASEGFEGLQKPKINCQLEDLVVYYISQLNFWSIKTCEVVHMQIGRNVNHYTIIESTKYYPSSADSQNVSHRRN
ncbi:hypothetical protein RF11_10784 [Thelohanellus kitauei]|uniref:ABC transporter domain-containing protein n=1 Tax=Thelohanellus kitauei TaxID=669202 RepID=A0A0C2N3E4_THEKT|nr:hypothetical protein RF11_10784 [Thelohanellus kitauei]